MAEHNELHDGRFGENFDDELGTRGLGQIGIGLAVTCIVAMVIVWVMLRDSLAETDAGPRVPAAEELGLPAGPVLQTDPEGEYERMRHELDEHLNGYGWVDEAAGTVHIPIDTAFELLLERGAGGSAASAEASDDAGAAETASEDGGE